MTDLEEVKKALMTVEEPELHRDIVSLNMVKNVTVDKGIVTVTVELTTPACPLKDELKKRVETAVSRVPWVVKVNVELTSRVVPARPVTGKMPVEGVKNVIAVYACKGGVGKSTVATNLSAALAARGAQVGLLDADIHGPNIPLMMGVNGRPSGSEKNKLLPLAAHGVKLMSLGFLADPNMPMIWRGPMVHGAVQQLLRDTEWGELDYLIVDLPPGTGDAQLTIVQSVPLAGVVFVSTPQAVSLADGVKGIEMFRKLNVPILGLVENMSGFECPSCHHVTDIFKKGGGEAEAARYQIPFLGAVPLDPRVVSGGDQGTPVVISHPSAQAAAVFNSIAERVAANVSVFQREAEQSPLSVS